MATFSIPRPSKIHPNRDFGMEIYYLATMVMAANEANQGCQMVYFHTKNVNYGILWRASFVFVYFLIPPLYR
jgi:hypothetical protein